jgi:hypothetical protein
MTFAFLLMGFTGIKRNCKRLSDFLLTGLGYGSIIPEPSDTDPDPLKHEPTKKLVGSIVEYLEQYVEAMEKVIEITGYIACIRRCSMPLFL